jgi:hypothetical protein
VENFFDRKLSRSGSNYLNTLINLTLNSATGGCRNSKKDIISKSIRNMAKEDLF